MADDLEDQVSSLIKTFFVSLIDLNNTITKKKFDEDNHEVEADTNSSDKKKHMFGKECKG